MAYIKKKKDGSYLVTVSCGRDSMDRKITKSTTFHPELCTAKGHPKTEKTILKEVQEFAAAFEKKVKTGAWTEGISLTFEKYSEKYLTEYAAATQAPRTLQSTESAVAGFIQDFGYMTLEALTPMYLQEYVNGLYQRKKASGREGTLSHGTVKRRAAVLSAMLSQAVRWNLIVSNPMDRVQLRQPEAPEEEKLEYFTQAQAEAFLDALDNPLMYEYRRTDPRTGKIQEYQSRNQIQTQLKLFFYLAIFAGARRGELIALKWPDIDFQESSVYIAKSTCRVKHEVINKITKSRKTRTVAVPSMVISLARQWKKEQARYRLSIGSKWEGEDFVFTQWNGRQMGLDTPYNAFKRIIDNYNAHRPENAPELPQIPLHGLRHTAATLLIGQKVDIRTVSGHLGHANASTTLNIYAHALKELDRAAADKMGELFEKKA